MELNVFRVGQYVKAKEGIPHVPPNTEGQIVSQWDKFDTTYYKVVWLMNPSYTDMYSLGDLQRLFELVGWR